MSWAPPLNAVFRIAAGPRVGFGHLVRARVLSQALGLLHPRVSVRGPREARAAAQRLGMAPLSVDAPSLLGQGRADVLILDDPSAAAAGRWCRAAHGLGVPVVSIHDLGLAFCGADLVVDGSLEPHGDPGGCRALRGTRYTILDPAVSALRRSGRASRATVLVALGGGPRPGAAAALAAAIRRRLPTVEIRVAGGFAAHPAPATTGVTFLGVVPGLAAELAACAVAVTGGGVTMYEAAALRTPLVAWPVVAAQHPAVEGFVRHGLAVAAGPGPRRLERAAAAVAAQLHRGRIRPATPEGRALDGRGAARVAAEIRALVRRRTWGAA